MSFSSEYDKLRKKRLEEEKTTKNDSSNKTFAEEYSALKSTRVESDDDIAPVLTVPTAFDDFMAIRTGGPKIRSKQGTIMLTPEQNFIEQHLAEDKRRKEEREAQEALREREEAKWFDGGAFSDGYQFGDGLKTAGATAFDLVGAGVQGVGGMLEGVTDLILHGTSKVAALVGADDFAEGVKEHANKNIINDAFEDMRIGAISKNSVLGRKPREFGQVLGQVGGIVATGGIAGAAGLGTVGTTLLTTGVMGTSSMGSGISEAYNSGATDSEAWGYGAMKGVVDAGSELIFGGLGKGVKALGISRGISSLDDAFAKKLSSKISNRVLSNAAEFGVKASAEGVEEVLAGLGTAAAKKLTYMSDEELSQLVKDENLLEQFVMGTLASGVMQGGGLVNSIKNDTDFITGLTTNEEKVVNKEFENRVAEKEKDGTTLTKREKTKLYDEVQRDFEKGYISTNTIEEVLGGEDAFKTYNELKAEAEEFKTLYETKSGDLSEAQRDRLAELKAKNTENSYDNLLQAEKDNISNSVLDMLAKERNGAGSKLFESYNEKTRRSQAFTADLSKYDTKQQATIQKAIDSGILNNTNRTHEFVDMIAKISADKGVSFDFTNNTKLKESGFAIDGKTVNGYVTKDGITLNIESAQSLRAVTGHEITHVLEGTEIYTEMQNVLFEYAKAKGDYQGRYDALTKLYEGVKGADINGELTADLVGDYLFTDSDFISKLSVEHRNVFQKIYDEIKYLFKIATAGSKEARQLEQVKRAFDKAYKESGNAKGDTKYSLTDNTGKNLTKEQNEYFKDSKVVDENGNLKVMYHGTPSGKFTVFKDGTYFTENKWYADLYQNPGASSISTGKVANAPKTYEVYLDIKKPFDINDAEARKIYINDYIKGGNAVGINPYLSDAEYSKIGAIDWTEGEDLRDFLIENGYDYDGLVLDEGAVGGYGDDVKHRGKSYVIFNPEQVKNVDNKTPTSNPDIRFSLSETVEETKDLVAVHNLSEEKLIKSLNLGGLPMPSIAIARAKEGHSSFGNISLVFNKETIDPQFMRSNKAYSGDAWTPTYPRVDYKVNDKAQEKIENRINNLVPEEVARDLGGLHIDTYNLEQDLNRHNGNLAEIFRTNTALKYAFLVESGNNLELPTRSKPLGRSSNHDNEAIIRVAETVSEEKLRGILREYTTEQIYEVEPEIRKAVNEYLQEKYKNLPEKAKEMLITEDTMSRGNIDAYAREALNYLENGIEQEVDYSAARTLINETIDARKYENWVKDVFSNIVEKEGIRNNKDLFTPSGNRRSFEALHYEHNLENVIKAMKEDGEKGIGSFGRGNIFGAATTEYGSIAEIKEDAQNRMKQIPEEEYEKIRKGFSDRFFELAYSLPIHKDSFTATDDAANMLIEAVSKFKTKSGMANYIRKESQGWANYSDYVVDDLIELVSDIRNMPVGYFEAKPQRAVGFNEVATAIIPNNASEKLKQMLNENGISFVEYENGNEQARTEILNSLEDAKFSLSEQNETPKKYGDFNFYGKDLKLERPIAPVQDSVQDIAPVQEVNSVTLRKELRELEDYIRTNANNREIFPDSDSLVEVLKKREALEKKVVQLEAEEKSLNRDKLNSLTDEDAPPESDIFYPELHEFTDEDYERITNKETYTETLKNLPEDPFEERDIRDVGSQKVKAYQYENPEVKPFFQREAEVMLNELNGGLKGKRYTIDDGTSHSKWTGQNRVTSDEIAYLLDNCHYTYDQIENGLKAIIEDNGAENNACSKRIEFMLNNRLMKGYNDMWDGSYYPPDQDYIDLLREKEINAYSEEAYKHFFENADDYAPPVDINSITDADAPMEVEAPYYGESEKATPSDPFESRDIKAVGNPKAKAYVVENPEALPYFQEVANAMLGDLQNTVRGERHPINDADGYIVGWDGTRRQTTDDLAYLLDNYNYTYEQIESALNAIIEGNGKYNAVAKRIEFLLNDRLIKGYTDVSGYDIPPNQDYINLLNQQQTANAVNRQGIDAVEHIPDDIAPMRETTTDGKYIPKYKSTPIQTVSETDDIAPIRETAQRTEQQAEEEKIAKIVDADTKKPKRRGIISLAKEYILDNGRVFEDVAKKTKNRELEAKWNSIRYSDGMAQRFIKNGKNGVKSIEALKNEVDKSGLTEDFEYYMYHRHNVDRMGLESRVAPKILEIQEQLGLDDAQIVELAEEKIKHNTPKDEAAKIRSAREYARLINFKNKAVFGDSVTAEVSQAKVEAWERQHPEFKQWAEEVYANNKQLRQLMIDEGLITQETADLWDVLYPHYVPIRRTGHDGAAVNVPLDSNKTGVNAPIKRATGGNSDFYHLFDTMGTRAMQTYKAIAKNRFGVELKNTLGTTIEQTEATLDDAMNVDAHEELLKEGKRGMNPTFTVFEDGKRVEFEITEEMYDAMRPAGDALSYTNPVLNKLGNLRRGLLTEYNPTFMATNAIKDAQDILINSQHPARTYANLPKAAWELLSKGKFYNEYMEYGGEDNTYFEKDTNTFKKERNAFVKALGVPLNAISTANNFIERIPRLAEYMASRKAGRSIDVSMLDAARVTTNFAAGGKLTKMLNRNGVTFLNASVQGAVQQVRNIQEAKMNGFKGWVGLASKCAIAGLPALLLNHLLWDDDEEYEELSDYVKDNYYIVAKTEDGHFVRIPKGRTVAVIQNAFTQMENLATGEDEADFARFFDLVKTNLAPNSVTDNHILAPIQQVRNNEAWYGGDLVPTRLQDLPEAEQYDESTDEISKWLGEKLNYSPYKINYLLDQYLGGVGDMILPMLTPDAERGDGNMFTAPFLDKFTTDPVMKNQSVSDFYTTKDELTVNANSIKATDEDILMSKYMNSVNADLGELYQQKREIQNSDLPDSEKYAEVRRIQGEIDSIARDSLNTYNNVNIDGNYATIGDIHFRMDKGEWKKITEDQLEQQEKVTSGLGISASAYWDNKGEYDFAYEYPEKYDFFNSIGLSYKTYKDLDEDGKRAYSWAYENPDKFTVSKAVANDVVTYRQYTGELYDIKADKDANGKSISGSRKEKVIEYVNNLDIDYGAKLILFKSEYNADDTYNYEIIDYLNGRDDISYDEMETILKELGFTVHKDGTISWD